MFRILFLITLVITLFGPLYAQERGFSIEVFVLTDITTQAYEEEAAGLFPYLDKNSNDDFVKSFGVGGQVAFNLSPRFIFQAGTGMKYTSMEFWFQRMWSSDSKWYNLAVEDVQQIHLFVPLSIYIQSVREKRFRIRPGLSLEPNLLLYNKGSITILNEDIISNLAEPEGSPRRLLGIASFNLKFSYGFQDNREVYTELKIHNTPRFFNEEFGLMALPIGAMCCLGYRF